MIFIILIGLLALALYVNERSLFKWMTANNVTIEVVGIKTCFNIPSSLIKDAPMLDMDYIHCESYLCLEARSAIQSAMAYKYLQTLKDEV